MKARFLMALVLLAVPASAQEPYTADEDVAYFVVDLVSGPISCVGLDTYGHALTEEFVRDRQQVAVAVDALGIGPITIIDVETPFASEARTTAHDVFDMEVFRVRDTVGSLSRELLQETAEKYVIPNLYFVQAAEDDLWGNQEEAVTWSEEVKCFAEDVFWKGADPTYCWVFGSEEQFYTCQESIPDQYTRCMVATALTPQYILGFPVFLPHKSCYRIGYGAPDDPSSWVEAVNLAADADNWPREPEPTTATLEAALETLQGSDDQ